PQDPRPPPQRLHHGGEDGRPRVSLARSERAARGSGPPEPGSMIRSRHPGRRVRDVRCLSARGDVSASTKGVCSMSGPLEALAYQAEWAARDMAHNLDFIPA